MDEKREVEQPLATSAASDTATRPLFEKFITTSVGSGWGEAVRAISPPTKMEKVAKFQPDMVKIGFAARLLQIYRNLNLPCPLAAQIRGVRPRPRIRPANACTNRRNAYV
ncbi:mlr4313 [Mesorhizobium japonicum MAFF 303099]|uniref:Mlr4313 protein n=1 Tax=Mesorhizobium japonicum (strain LMG 29417 / CECT 9101 / MAFF 303099) TaxID=266835 RepID=Q98EC0_RHILO|nr:mlr4313 [Mesorhizobium japonicum MAFF 303099]